MTPETICKTVHQYNKFPVSDGDMKKLLEIAEDYRTVKNYVYQRYGGIKSLDKIYPGYTVQKEMAQTGLREQLGLPSVYFNVAILDALGDVKSQWTRTKSTVLRQINANQNFSEDDKHYLRFVLKVSNAFELVLNGKEVSLKSAIQEKYDELAALVEVKRLNSYLRRQVRKYHVKAYTDKADGFSLSERAYRYGSHGIYITMKEKRKRIFVELTDNNRYVRQISIKLFPKESRLEILVPIEVKPRAHEDFINTIGLSVGMRTMLTTNEGHKYGEKLGEYQMELTQWMRRQNAGYARTRDINPGRKKYTSAKKRMTEQLHSYINMELNRLIQTEKPKTIYIPKLPPAQKHGGDKTINYSVSMWQRGYIRKRLQQKCMEHSIEIVEVFGKGISSVCCRCNETGRKEKELFLCPNCGTYMDAKTNAACNARNRGQNVPIKN